MFLDSNIPAPNILKSLEHKIIPGLKTGDIDGGYGHGERTRVISLPDPTTLVGPLAKVELACISSMLKKRPTSMFMTPNTTTPTLIRSRQSPTAAPTKIRRAREAAADAGTKRRSETSMAPMKLDSSTPSVI